MTALGVNVSEPSAPTPDYRPLEPSYDVITMLVIPENECHGQQVTLHLHCK